jgi:hypothetical protein
LFLPSGDVSSAITGSTTVEPDELEVAPEERQQRNLHLEPLRGDEVAGLAPRRVGDAHVVGDDPRPHADAQRDVAADGDLAPGRRLEPREHGTDQLIEVEREYRDADRAQRQEQRGARDDDSATGNAHATIVPSRKRSPAWVRLGT